MDAPKENLPENTSLKSMDSFLGAVHNYRTILGALRAGTLSCLPGRDGYADTSPVVNLVDGTAYNGLSLLLLKEHQHSNNFTTAEYATLEQVKAAKVSLGGKFRASPEEAKEFTERLEEKLLEKTIHVQTKEGRAVSAPNPFSLPKVCNEAMASARGDVEELKLSDQIRMAEMAIELGEDFSSEQKQVHKKGRTR